MQDNHEVLGAAGLAEVRRLAEQAHARKPSGRAEKQLVESLHRPAHDMDALVELYAADLAPGGWTHPRIARTLDDAGRPAQALEWAERGLRSTHGERHVHDELVDYVTQRYAADGRHADALTVRRERFRAELTLSIHRENRELRTAATTAGRDSESGERAAALDALRAAARKYARTAAHLPYGIPALLDVGNRPGAPADSGVRAPTRERVNDGGCAERGEAQRAVAFHSSGWTVYRPESTAAAGNGCAAEVQTAWLTSCRGATAGDAGWGLASWHRRPR